MEQKTDNQPVATQPQPASAAIIANPQATIMPQEKSKTGGMVWLILIILVMLVIVGGAVLFYFYNQKSSVSNVPTPSQTAQQIQPAPAEDLNTQLNTLNSQDTNPETDFASLDQSLQAI